MRPLFLLIILSIFVDSTFSKGDSQCTGCLSHRTTIFPFLRNAISDTEFDEFRLHLLRQVDQCTRANFSVSVYLPGNRTWLHCCNARDCTRRFLDIRKSHVTTTRVRGPIDLSDASGAWARTLRVMTSTIDDIYVISDFAIPQICRFSRVRVSYIQGIVPDLGATLARNCNVTIASSFSQLNTINKPLCTRSPVPSNRVQVCPTEKPDSYDDPNAVDLRIFLGFSTQGHFHEVLKGLSSFLSQKALDSQEGKIAIMGKRAGILANCWWYNVHKCILDLRDKGEERIYVRAERVNRVDIDFAPDVLGYMRKEAIRGTKNRTTFVLVVSDFISLTFVENKWFFEEAMSHQRIGLVLGVMLKWNGLDKQTAVKYYGKLVSDDSMYPMEVFADMNGLAGRIVNVSIPKPEINETEATTEMTIGTTTLPMQNRTMIGQDVVIVTALADWTSARQLMMLRSFLTSKAGVCVNNDQQYAVLRNEHEKVDEFCNDLACLNKEINGIDEDTAVARVPNTVEMIKAGLDLLEQPESDQFILPILILVTNYIDTGFMREYDDSGTSFRKSLSFVDFQIILINSSINYHVDTSLSNKIIHRVNTFEELQDAANPFCQNSAAKPDYKPHMSREVAVIVSISGVILLAVVVLLVVRVCRSKPVQQDKIPILPRDRKDRSGSNIGMLNVATLSAQRDDPWEMSRQQIIQGAEIGRGSGGVVYRGAIIGKAPCEYIYRRNFYAYQYENCPVAIKEQLIGTERKGRQQLLDEIEIMKAIGPHPNIANMLGCVTTVYPVCLLLEYAEGGSLKQFVQGKPILPATSQPCCNHDGVFCCRDVFAFLWQICDGMSFVHECGVIHRDIAARNVLLIKGRNIVIADFGLAIWKQSRVNYEKNKRLPYKWMCPEALQRAEFSEASDVWSFAITAWEILTSGAEPFEHVPVQEILSYLNSGKLPERPHITCDPLWRILNNCWAFDPERRPTFAQLKEELAPLLEATSSSYGYVKPIAE